MAELASHEPANAFAVGAFDAERLVAQGRSVRALVREGSPTTFLDRLGVEVVRGDLADRASCGRAVRGVAVVYHAAAKVGDWGRWSERFSVIMPRDYRRALEAQRMAEANGTDVDRALMEAARG